MRAVVTGGAGFLGSHLCDRLLEMGYDVLCIDNLITGNTDNIVHLFADLRPNFVNHDVTEYLYVEGTVHAVLHFASPASLIDHRALPLQTSKVGHLGPPKALERV